MRCSMRDCKNVKELDPINKLYPPCNFCSCTFPNLVENKYLWQHFWSLIPLAMKWKFPEPHICQHYQHHHHPTTTIIASYGREFEKCANHAGAALSHKRGETFQRYQSWCCPAVWTGRRERDLRSVQWRRSPSCLVFSEGLALGPIGPNQCYNHES